MAWGVMWRGEPARGEEGRRGGGEELFKEKTMKKTNDGGSAVRK